MSVTGAEIVDFNIPTERQLVEKSNVTESYDKNGSYWVSVFLYVQFFANVLINVDSGILPAASLQIKKELNIENS